MPKYNHAFSLAFSIESDHPKGEDVTQLMLYKAIHKRLQESLANNELVEACGVPWDTYENPEEGEFPTPPDEEEFPHLASDAASIDCISQDQASDST